MSMGLFVSSVIGGLVVLGIGLAIYETARLLKRRRQRPAPPRDYAWGERLDKGERGGGGRVVPGGLSMPKFSNDRIDKGFPPSGVHAPPDYVCRKCRKSFCHDREYCPLFPEVKPPMTLYGGPASKWSRCVCFVHTCYDLDELIREYAAQGGLDDAEDELTFT